MYLYYVFASSFWGGRGGVKSNAMCCEDAMSKAKHVYMP